MTARHSLRLTAACLTAFAASFMTPRLSAQDAAALQKADAPPNGVWVDSLDLSKEAVRRPRLPRGQTGTPPPLKFVLGGTAYAHALPLASDGDVELALAGAASRFEAIVGVDDSVPAGSGSVLFGAWVDGHKVFDSGVMRGGDAPKSVSLDLTGARSLVLAMNDANDGTGSDTAEWAGALVTMKDGEHQLTTSQRPDTRPRIAPSRSAAPTINFPRITGATPGRPFLFRIPASGDGDLTFSATNLPPGITMDSKTGIISGSLRGDGRWNVPVTVRNAAAQTSSTVLTIVGGKDALALTPPLGWNSWNVWAAQVDDAKVRAAADGMVASGLAAQGYTYINIDDAWEGPRTPDGEITSNEKFPDMKALADYVHAKGLKIGIYSSPGPRTCQERFAGSYQHEEQDARTWSKWGFDYIKYDWCSYSDVEPLASKAPLESLQKPYVLMRGILDKLDRDFVFSLCQYGWGKVWEWGDQVGGNLWRVTGDITDTWPSMSSIGFQQTGHEQYAGPGHWNDTDMLVVGKLGWGRAEGPRQTQLTYDEQLTHISLWALQAAPLLIGADLSQADDFTRDLLGNREVIGIDQDPLGRAAHRVTSDGWTEVWARPLADGRVAVGLFNRAPVATVIRATLSDLGVKDQNAPVHFPWTHADLPDGASGAYEASVPRHGVLLAVIGRATKP
ncbi:MAG TPA: NPCBM/NEW2 domain-containing protein [Vicinamibacterales bacterium]|jgi:alpha-galactosidase|nr:NPCBM/NEW2 domain-containing protein [Vicinamibacterales bacterium]